MISFYRRRRYCGPSAWMRHGDLENGPNRALSADLRVVLHASLNRTYTGLYALVIYNDSPIPERIQNHLQIP